MRKNQPYYSHVKCLLFKLLNDSFLLVLTYDVEKSLKKEPCLN